MIPIKDDNPTHHVPLVTIVLILVNVAVFVFQWILGDDPQAFAYRLGAIPWEITRFRELSPVPDAYRSQFPNILTLFTSMFVHGGILHLLGNMLYLWIFGDNVEAIMGHGRFLFFYVTCGLVATLSHIVVEPSSMVPMVGASGAISGILGAYFLRFPRARVHVLFILFFFIRIARVSALFVLGFWFVMQLFNGFGTLGMEGQGVAWFAHIGGFVAGMVLVFLFERKERVRIYRRANWWW